VNALFQVIQNILRRRQQKTVCPQCGRAADAGLADTDAGEADQADGSPPDSPDSTYFTGAQDPDASRCPDCGRSLTGGHTG
jgi:ribosomal protein L34E